MPYMHISIPDVDLRQEFYQSFLTPEWISQKKKDLKSARKNRKAYNLDVFVNLHLFNFLF